MIWIDDRHHSARALSDLAARQGERLAPAIRPGLRLAVCLPDPLDWLAVMTVARAAGAGVLPLHPATPRAAAERMARAAGCRFLLFQTSEPQEVAPEAPPAPVGELVQMSSGTTGAPKIIARPWDDIERELDSYVASFREPEGMTPVVACPITHSYGLICGLLAGLRRGAEPVVIDPGNPRHLLRRLREVERPLLYASPAILHTLARLLPEDERLHAAMTSGTILPDAWFDRIRARTTHLFQQYGCSEAGCIAVNPDMAASTDLGHPLPHHRLRAGHSAEAPAEIVLDGPRGTVHTSDLGYLRAGDGMLVFLSRLDDTIIVAGLNVYPKEVEDVVMALGPVSDAVAFRLSDPFAGERVGLVFTAAEPLPVASVHAWCRTHLAAHQQPVAIIQTDRLPRMANGKISRREVAAHYAGAGVHGGQA